MHEGWNPEAEALRVERLTCVAALVLLLTIIVAVASCGGDDLVFPGELYTQTATPEETATPTA